MTIEFRDTKGKYIKQWHNWDSEVPQKDDVVLLHFGDDNEEEVEYIVIRRIISGINSQKIIIVIDKI